MILLINNMKDKDRLFGFLTNLIIFSTTILSICIISDFLLSLIWSPKEFHL